MFLLGEFKKWAQQSKKKSMWMCFHIETKKYEWEKNSKCIINSNFIYVCSLFKLKKKNNNTYK